MEIIKATKDNDIKKIAALAQEIWTEHFTPILGKDQVEYMIFKFQSYEAISRYIKENNYSYYYLTFADKYFGYIGLQIQGNNLFLSKLYIKKEYRSKGYGRLALEFLDTYALKYNLKSIYLTVNKNNLNSIAAYLKCGYIKTKEEKADIGYGFFMDDYIMTKKIP